MDSDRITIECNKASLTASIGKINVVFDYLKESDNVAIKDIEKWNSWFQKQKKDYKDNLLSNEIFFSMVKSLIKWFDSVISLPDEKNFSLIGEKRNVTTINQPLFNVSSEKKTYKEKFDDKCKNCGKNLIPSEFKLRYTLSKRKMNKSTLYEKGFCSNSCALAFEGKEKGIKVFKLPFVMFIIGVINLIVINLLQIRTMSGILALPFAIGMISLAWSPIVFIFALYQYFISRRQIRKEKLSLSKKRPLKKYIYCIQCGSKQIITQENSINCEQCYVSLSTEPMSDYIRFPNLYRCPEFQEAMKNYRNKRKQPKSVQIVTDNTYNAIFKYFNLFNNYNIFGIDIIHNTFLASSKDSQSWKKKFVERELRSEKRFSDRFGPFGKEIIGRDGIAEARCNNTIIDNYIFSEISADFLIVLLLKPSLKDHPEFEIQLKKWIKSGRPLFIGFSPEYSYKAGEEVQTLFEGLFGVSMSLDKLKDKINKIDSKKDDWILLKKNPNILNNSFKFNLTLTPADYGCLPLEIKTNEFQWNPMFESYETSNFPLNPVIVFEENKNIILASCINFLARRAYKDNDIFFYSVMQWALGIDIELTEIISKYGRVYDLEEEIEH